MGKDIPEGAHQKLAEALRWASDMVKETGYAAGTDHITLADLCFLVRVCIHAYKILCEITLFPGDLLHHQGHG